MLSSRLFCHARAHLGGGATVPALRLYWNGDRLLCVGLLLLTPTASALLLGATVVIGLLIGAIPGAVHGGFGSSAGHRFLALVVLQGVMSLLAAATNGLQRTLAGMLATEVRDLVRNRIVEAAMEPTGIAHLEDTEYQDQLRLAQGGWTDLGSSVTYAAALYALILQVAGSAAILFRFHWWAALLALAGAGVQAAWAAREAERSIRPQTAAVPGQRRAYYFQDLALSPAAAKELRVFGLGRWAVEESERWWASSFQDLWAGNGSSRAVAAATMIAVGSTQAVVLFSLLHEGLDGALALGPLVVFALASLGLQAWVGRSGLDLTAFRMGARGALHLNQVCLEPVSAQAKGPISTSAIRRNLAPEVAFEGVHFRYPGQNDWVFDGLDLVFRSGRSTAVVGENGSGKTTLIKLLARLHEPQSGRITIDGEDISRVDVNWLRERLAVILQDFVHYPLPVRENVGFGRLSRLNDDEALRHAAASADVLEMIESLPLGWNTPLITAAKSGVDLSGGQWQRIALARALLAGRNGAGVLILDEPTANLDVRTEARLFDRFLEASAGLTTILISHRFSTVRTADDICVLDAGRLRERGSHQELMAKRGLYAEMFEVQAMHFRGQANG